MSCKFLIPLLTAVFLAAPAFAPATMASLSDYALAQNTPTTPTMKTNNLNLSKSNVNRTAPTPTAAKTGGKPTKDQRTGGVSSERAVHSGKSNSNDRAVTFGRDKLKGTTKNSGHATEK